MNTSQRFGAVRRMPINEPTLSAITSAQTATDRVQPHDDISHCR